MIESKVLPNLILRTRQMWKTIVPWSRKQARLYTEGMFLMFSDNQPTRQHMVLLYAVCINAIIRVSGSQKESFISLVSYD